MSFVERIKVTDGTEVASVNASNQLEVAEANSNAIKTAVELIDNAISGNEMQVDIVASLPAGTNNIGDVDVLSVPAPLNVVGGGTESAALRVTIANDSTGVVSVDDNGTTLSVDDGGSSITVDGTVAATQSGTWNITNVSGTVSLPTGAATSANQSTAITALQLLDDVVAVDGSAALTKLYQVGGTDGTNAQILSTNASGHLNIADGGNSITVDGTVGVSGTVTVADGGGSLTVDGTIAATQSGTWNITNVSGTVSLPTGAATSANQSTMITALQLLDNVVATDGSAALTQLYQVGGTDGTNAQILSTNASGHLNIADGGNSITVDGTVTATLDAGNKYIGNVRLTDGTTNAEVVPLAGYNAQAVAIVDGSGNQITSFGGGTQYTEGDTDATITGTALMFETDTGTSALGVVSTSNPLPISDNGSSLTIDNSVLTDLSSSIVNVNDVSATKLVTVGGIFGSESRALQMNDDGWLFTESYISNLTSHDGVASLFNWFPIAGYASSSTPTAVSSGDYSRIWTTLNGAVNIADGNGTISIDDGGGSITVDGTFWQATQPVSIAAAVAVTDNSGSLTVDDGGITLSIDDGGGAITVDGTVSITANSSVNLSQVGGNTVVTGGTNGTLAIGGVQAHDAIYSGNNPVVIGGVASSATPTAVAVGDVSRLWMTTSGAVHIADGNSTISIDDGAGSITVDGTVGVSGTVTVADGGGSLTVDGTVSITANSSVNVAQFGGTNVVTGGTAGTQAIGGIQAHDAAVSNNNPVLIAGVGSTSTPTSVSADGDVTRLWLTRTGAANVHNPSFDSLGGAVGQDGLGLSSNHLVIGASDGLDNRTVLCDSSGSLIVNGNAPHDFVDSGNPMKIGAKAIAHGTNPTAVAASDRTDLYANRHGILWTISGHPNLRSAEYFTDAARTNDNVLPLISAGTKYVITGITVIASAANTVNVSVRIGFGAAAVPTQGASGADAVTGVVLSHPNIPPGSGFSKGHAGGIVGIGGDGEDLYITCSAPTTGSLIVQVDYYTIES